MHKENLVIVGASGHGKVVADIALLMGQYENVYFMDDFAHHSECMGIPIIGKTDNIDEWLETADFFVAIGNTNIRKCLLEKIQSKKASIATLVHPNAVIGSNVTIGEGTVVMAGVVLNADCCVGKGCIINTGATVDHDCIIGDYVHVSVGAHVAGTVSVGECTWIGAGAVISNNVSILGDCTIGAGAVVVGDIETSGTYVGVPARKINR